VFTALSTTLDSQDFDDLKLYSFQGYPDKRVDIRIDKVTEHLNNKLLPL
jgi:hypothetical protein